MFDPVPLLQIGAANPNADREQVEFMCIAELLRERDDAAAHASQLSLALKNQVGPKIREKKACRMVVLKNHSGPRISRKNACKEVAFADAIVHQLDRQLNSLLQYLQALPHSSISRGTFSAFRFVVSSSAHIRAAAFLRDVGVWAAGEVTFLMEPDDVAGAEELCRRFNIRWA